MINNTCPSPSSPQRGVFTPRQRQEFVDRFLQSGLSAKQFAQQEHIGYSTLRNWLSLHRITPSTDSKARLLEIPTVPVSQSPHTSQSPLAEVSLPSGVSVRIHGSVVTDFVHLLGKALQ